MAIEDDDQIDQTTTGDQTTTTVPDTTTTPDKTTTTPDPSEALLDRFMENTDGPKSGRRQGAADTTQTPPAGQGPGQKGQQQTPQQLADKQREVDGRFAPTQQVPAAKRQYGNLFLADGKGDIYDARGQLIAKQGYGRTVFHQLYPYIETAATENASLKQRLDNYDKANEIAKTNGLTLEDHGAAMTLMVQWKKDPVQTLNTLLRVAEQRGIDVTSIRGGGAVDTAALRAQMEELLDARFKPFQPFVENLQRQREQDEQETATMTEYHSFMQQYPDAGPHQGAIANVMRDHQMTPREAYFALQAMSARMQLDWSKDLAPQLEARAKQSGTQNGQVQPNGSGQDRALPNMNGGRTNTGGTVDAGSRSTGTGEESWDQLLRQTFKQHGIDV